MLWLCFLFSSICFVTNISGTNLYVSETNEISSVAFDSDCLKCNSLFEKGKAYSTSSVTDSALFYLKKSSNHCSCNPLTHIKALILQANIYARLAQYDKALFYYKKAKTLASHYDYEPYFYDSSFKMYSMYVQLKNSYIAKEFYLQTLQQNDLPDYVTYFCYEGLSFVNLHGVHKDYSQALMWAYKALYFEKKLERKINNPRLSIAMSELYLEQGNIDSVARYINKAKVLYNKKNDDPCFKVDYLLIESTYLATLNKDFKGAKESLDKAQSLALNYNCFDQKTKVIRLSAFIDAHYKDYKNAYTKLSSVQLLIDSNKVDKRRINAENTNDDIKISLNNLNAQHKARQEELSIIINQSKLAIVLFCLFISLLVFTFLQARKIDEKNQKLISITKLRVKESIQNKKVLSIDKLESIHLESHAEANGIDDNEESNTPLSNELILELSEKLDVLVRDKFYLNSEITINNLARDLGTNRYYLSQIIQLQYKTNFNHFLNELRIKDIIILFEQNENQKYTLEGLSQQVGFNSVSTFSRAFKRYTGLSPRVYLSNMNKV